MVCLKIIFICLTDGEDNTHEESTRGKKRKHEDEDDN